MAEFAPDQGWESYQNQIRLHPPSIPVPTGPGDAGPSVPSLPVNAGPKDSTPASVSNAVQPAAAPDVQHVAAPAVTVASAFNAPAASADSAVPVVSAPAPVSSVFSDSSGPQPLAGTSGGGSVFVSDTGADGAGFAQYASYGWYIVPSIGNDPGSLEGSAGDSGGWGYADAGYATDWFFA